MFDFYPINSSNCFQLFVLFMLLTSLYNTRFCYKIIPYIIEHYQDTFTPAEINRRIEKVVSHTTPHKQELDGHWRVSFEEGIEDINDDQLPKSGDGKHDLGLKLIHTQWRYDFGFTTPTCM
jgi:hypothetical protein